MEDLKGCPMCESPVHGSGGGFSCPECGTVFSYVGGAAVLIERVGRFDLVDLREAAQSMTDSHLWNLDI